MRPAHLHVILRAPGHARLTTQLSFTGGEHGWDTDHAHAADRFRGDPDRTAVPA